MWDTILNMIISNGLSKESFEQLNYVRVPVVLALLHLIEYGCSKLKGKYELTVERQDIPELMPLPAAFRQWMMPAKCPHTWRLQWDSGGMCPTLAPRIPSRTVLITHSVNLLGNTLSFFLSLFSCPQSPTSFSWNHLPNKLLAIDFLSQAPLLEEPKIRYW